mmetsp:Transcript_28897/g.73773  ORF Transcript_28897/g.73773 Transcript_28897/m.73773 type:complete len:237 (+) Transcript_28897:470-1180(+)
MSTEAAHIWPCLGIHTQARLTPSTPHKTNDKHADPPANTSAGFGGVGSCNAHAQSKPLQGGRYSDAQWLRSVGSNCRVREAVWRLAQAGHAKDLHLPLANLALVAHVLALLLPKVVLLGVVHLRGLAVAGQVGHATLLHAARLQVRHLLLAILLAASHLVAVLLAVAWLGAIAAIPASHALVGHGVATHAVVVGRAAAHVATARGLRAATAAGSGAATAAAGVAAAAGHLLVRPRV